MAVVIAACGSTGRQLPPAPAPAVHVAPSAPVTQDAGVDPNARIDYLEEKLAEVQRDNIGLRDRLDVLVRRQDALTAGAPADSNTLAKLTARHNLLMGLIDYAESLKASWWCGEFGCVRTEAMCNALEEGSTPAGEPADKCVPRRRVYCRGFGKPFIGSAGGRRHALKDMMTCHAFLSGCEKFTTELGGAPCLGVE